MVNTRNVLLSLHILVAFVTIGPFLLFDMVMPRLVRSGDVGAVALVHRLSSKLGPATLVIVVFGVALVAQKDGYEFSDRWIIAALALYVLIVANGVGMLLRTGGKALAKLEAGEPAPVEARTLSTFGAINIVLILAILWLMVAKPEL